MALPLRPGFKPHDAPGMPQPVSRWDGPVPSPEPERPQRRWRENLLLLSGIFLVLLAATMAVGAGIGH